MKLIPVILLKDHEQFKKGDVLDVDSDTLKEFVEGGIAQVYNASKTDDIKGIIESAIKEHLKPVTPSPDTKHEAPAKPFKSFGEQLMAVKEAATNHRIDERLMTVQKTAAMGLNEAFDTEGGFLVQQDFQQGLFQILHDNANLKNKCKNVPISATANGLVWNAVDETSRATGSRFGGLQVYWAHEQATKTASKPKFRRMSLYLEKLIGLYYATDELLADTNALASMISQWFGSEFGFMVDDAIVNGTGAGQPLGIITADCTITVDKESSQTAATIVAENIEKMYSRMHSKSIAKAEWYINQDCWPQLFQLKHTVGTGGVPVFMPPTGLQAAPYGMLMGRPINVIEQCQTLGTEGDIIFADLSQYFTIEKGGIESASSIHVKFTTDETAFRFVMRMNGQPLWSSALTPYKGGSTKTVGPFVTLQTRS